jgi:hypothetical protein
MSSTALNLADLSVGMPGLTSAKGISLAEAAAVCLENQEHASGVAVTSTGCDAAALLWTSVTPQQIATNFDLQDATEDGAAAVAILAVRQKTGKIVMQRAVKGLGFDYWMGTENDADATSDLPFQNLTRLEVSGILRGTQSQVTSRVNTKVAQVEPTDDVCPSIISVVEFSGPRIHLEGE